MIKSDDTIAAIATGLSPAGIGIVRISGSDAVSVAHELFRDKKGNRALKDFQTHTIHYGFIYEGNDPVDEVMVSVMRAPNSYTREDIVEINCHGGIYVLNRILRIILEHGVRPAEPGEFSKRAFLSGRIDLTEAEGIMDLISAQSEASRISSMEHVRGRLHDTVDALRAELLGEISFIEAGIDDPEHIDLDAHSDELKNFINTFENKLNVLKDSFNDGRILREGIRVVLCGKPNVGKSSILNYLSRSEAAIVTDIPGTTRDIIDVSVQISDIVVHLTDTAGIRQTGDEIEKIGVDRSVDSLKKADLILLVFDISDAPGREDVDIVKMLLEYDLMSRVLIIFNKADKGTFRSEPGAFKNDINKTCGFFMDKIFDNIKDPDISNISNISNIFREYLFVSAKTGLGFDELKDNIRNNFINGKINYNDQIIITNERHFFELSRAIRSILLVGEGIDAGIPIDMVTIDLMDAYTSLSAIIGKNVDDDLVNEIFSKFCMGK